MPTPLLDTLPDNIPSITKPQQYGVGSKSGRQVIGTARSAGQGLPLIYGSILQNALASAPLLAQSNLDTLLGYAPRLASAESAASRAGQEAQANTSADILGGAGQRIATNLSNIDKSVDPEYYQGRAGFGSGISSLLGGLNPNELSGSETANIERNANRNNIGQGTANSGSNLATVKNAMLFGQGLQNKQSQVSNILSQVSSALPALKTAGTNFANLTGQSGAGAGSQFYNSTADAFQGAGNIGSNLLGQAGNIIGSAYSIDKAKPPGWQQVVGSLPDYS